MGLHTPAGRGGLCAGDVLMEVGGTSVIFLTHSQVRSQYKPHQSTDTSRNEVASAQEMSSWRSEELHFPYSLSSKITV
jgi:hypothetical protein